ncbi:hypothetical protein HJ01_03395 [Flavobacterium frigoris PS1]|uniref:Uncharacterized protein n=1 Tax=Flavobacterium frigoris (strain PS1) TaxID=1086011 RepID=H7FW48_FLAFP|nr:hypothetical protein HJ01_03395 [Flavobacterium frigoris PS1]
MFEVGYRIVSKYSFTTSKQRKLVTPNHLRTMNSLAFKGNVWQHLLLHHSKNQ